MPHLVRNWVAANVAGEVLGLGVAAVIAIAVAQAGTLPPGAKVLVAVAAFLAIGLYEGAIVGAAQFVALRAALPAMPARSWIGATVVGAVVAWMLGCIPSALADSSGAAPQEPPFAVTAIAGAALGIVLGTAQWFVLRRHARRAAWWIAANAIAWAAGMPLIFAGADAAAPGTSMTTIAAIVVVTIAAAGAVVGAIEGVFLRLLLRPAGH